MSVAGTRRLCRVGLVAVLVTALCVLTLLDSPPQLPDPPADPPPTPGGEPPGTRSIVAYSWARRLALDYRPSKECDGNGTYGTTLNTFKLTDEKWLETIPGQLFLYSAHLDLRVAGYPSLRVIGVKRGPLPTSGLFCTVWYKEEERGRAVSVEALVSTIWLDEWGETVDSYAGILVGCQLPPDAAIEPSKVYVGLEPCHQNASHSLTINGEDRNEAKERRRQFTLCIKGLDFDEDISRKIVAFVEFHRILGAEHFYFYVFNVHENVLKVLRLYERSNVIRWFNLTLPGDLPNEKIARRRFLSEDIWIKRRMELIPYNHCFYDNLHRSEFVLPIDIDEAIVPARRKNWYELLLDERIKLGRNFKDFASYSVRNVYFFPELQTRNQTDRASFEVNSTNILPDLDYLDTIRTACISPEGDSVKSFVSTRRALTVHNHYALTTLNPSTRRAHHFDPEDVLKHHHRACDDRHLDCEIMMGDVRVDESALRYADELNRRMRTFFSDFKAFT
ncbi:uncharacterized protein LOC117159071 [Bombus vancouverensis nearcticus]|uniref:Glycosyltransferase family 92 protein n=2 Tax=Pyrobombus TaxID=144703 RepID=A0A6P8N9T3_9HYME|nr:uncharacterized protein LOC100749655 [Bombus impatiens]XP_033194487.1 uncharacterized protein LOC117159071 [Bombus vancouverensis nearcticus]XP_033311315.1 uncharacterized protein LOC117211487 [Bombus bifarius]